MDAPLARFAPVKINLFLEVFRRRTDGYHDVATIMETFAVGDTVSAERAEVLEVAADRADVPDGEANTAFKIIRAAERAIGRAMPARIMLTKRVAPGTGLGAGSSDAAAALDLALRLHDIPADADLRRRIAAEVGSDVGFFVGGGLALCTGRGEIVRALPHRGVRHVVLVRGGPACATSEVYRRVLPPAEPRSPEPWLSALDRGESLADDGASPFNRLAAAAEEAYPELAELRRSLTEAAGRAPHLSGSGGTFFFLAKDSVAAQALAGRVLAARPDLLVTATASYRGFGGGA